MGMGLLPAFWYFWRQLSMNTPASEVGDCLYSLYRLVRFLSLATSPTISGRRIVTELPVLRMK
jgi:hypothetical protein